MKYAFLDSDFVIKAHIIRKDEQHYLLEQILNKEGYVFCCHQRTTEEIERHNSSAYNWYTDQISRKRVQLYTDAQIVQELIDLYTNREVGLYCYTDLLKNACSCFSREYYSQYYIELDGLNYNCITPEAYLRKLEELDTAIGQGKNLGEIKTYLLMSWLSIKTGEQLLFFCSDDSGARQGSLAVKDFGIQCFTILSAFYWLYKEDGFDRELALPYLQSMFRFNKTSGVQKTRVRDSTQRNNCIKIDIEKAAEDIYKRKLGISPDGYLIY